ncbi:MAG: membrane protein insertase YidC [Lachnospiraceae bacterium]|nr:membrane protein insertase YidC [Lachnospiraceae bacterium]
MIPFAVLTQSTTPIIGWIAQLFGIIMNAIYNGLARIGIENIGLCIIIFTVFVNIVLLPLTIKQQKTTKITNFIQPEIKKVQSKYKGKNDMESRQRMNDEVQAVYDKYGASMTSGCLPLIIQLPILYGLYAVIRNVPAYVGAVKAVFMNIVTAIDPASSGFAEKFATVIEGMRNFNIDSYTAIAGTEAGSNWPIDVMATFTSQWEGLKAAFPSAAEVITENVAKINHFNSFLGLNLTATPSQKILSAMIIIPILAALTQFLSVKITTAGSQQTIQDDQAGAGMMKGMNYTMPIFSLIICFMLPIGIGLYWIASAVIRTIIIVIINRSLKDIDGDALIEANRAKAEAKARKRANSQMSAAQRAAQESAAAQYGATKRERINAGFARVNELDKATDEDEIQSGQTMANYTGRSVYDYEEEYAAQALEDPKAAKERARALKRGESGMSMAARVHMVQDYNAAHGENPQSSDGYRRKRKKK